MDLILTKITIPNECSVVSRERLIATLEESLKSHSTTLIIGRAGTGKTILAADFARNCGRRVAWYKVDAPDMNFHSFLRYLVESVAKERPGFGSRLLFQYSQTPVGSSLSLTAEAFVYDLQKQDEPLMVVIDDLHLVYDAAWIVPFFNRLLPLMPAEVHMMILGRSLPPAPLWRLRSKQRLCVIDEPALNFTREEAEALFAINGLDAIQANAAWLQTLGRAGALSEEAHRAKMAIAAA